jgi:phage gpG-like protein
MSGVNVQVTGVLPLKRQIEILKMPMQLRRRLISGVSRKIIADSKARVRTQTDLNGQPYAERAKKRKGARKMLSRLAREIKVKRNDGSEAVIGFFKPSSARIAHDQQYGKTTQMSARALNKSTDNTRKDSPATRRQARALREAGFTIDKRKKKGGRVPPLKWITQNLTIGQAGSVLRQLRELAGETIKTSWTTRLPARSFLGATPSEVSQHIDTIYAQVKQEIARVTR